MIALVLMLVPLQPPEAVRLGTTKFRTGLIDRVALAFTPDGRALLVATTRAVQVWDARSGTKVRDVPIAAPFVRSAAFSPDGKRVAVCGLEFAARPPTAVVRVIDLATGKVISEARRRSFDTLTLAFSGDGRHFAAVGMDAVSVHEADSGVELVQEKVSLGEPRVCFAGPTLVVGGSYTKALLWDWASGKPPRTINVGTYGCADVSLVGGVLATADSRDGGAVLWNATTGALIRRLSPTAQTDPCRYVALSPDGRRLAATSYLARAVLIWDVATGKELRRLPVERMGMSPVAWAADSRHLATQGDTSVRVWDVVAGTEVVDADGHRRHVNSVALFADGSALTGTDEGDVRLWDAAGRLRRVLRVSDENTPAVAASADGRWLAAVSGFRPGALTVWDLTTGKRRYAIEVRASAVAVTPDGRRVHASGADRFVRAWEVINGKAVADAEYRPDGEPPPDPDDRFGAESEMLQRSAFSADGRRFVVSRRGGVFAFDAQTGAQVAKVADDQGVVVGLAVSPDGARAVSSAWNTPHSLTVVDLDGGKRLHRVPHARKAAGPVAFRADGRRYAAASSDDEGTTSVTVYDAASGAVKGTVGGLTRVTSVAYGPDGKRLILGMADTTALVVPVPAK